MKTLILTLFVFLVGCGKDSAPLVVAGDEDQIQRPVDVNCGLIDACEGIESISDDKEFKCKQQKVATKWGAWSGVDYADYACYTTYRLQQKDPSCDPMSPNHVCQGPFGDVPCCHYFDIPGKTLDEILPLKAGCELPSSC